MSTLTKYGRKPSITIKYEDAVVANFMDGNSYTLTPISRLRIISASSIFGEPQYYRDGISAPSKIKNIKSIINESIFSDLFTSEMSAADVFTNAIDAALDFDFKATLELAIELRTIYHMRLNPAVIFIRASLHKNRQEFNEKNPGFMKSVGKKIALIPNDITNQFDYYMFVNGRKNKLPSIIKRTWSETLSSLSRYHLNKYKGKKLIDLIRISHANSEDINELLRTGTINVLETEQTWESLRSSGKSWNEILTTINMPHMALLRNLRGIFSEISKIDQATEILEKLKKGVANGKQFPFRYYSAYRTIKNENSINFKVAILDALEECIDISISNMPKLDGTVACLSDNSGSSWGTFNSEYGTVTVAEIANLSSLITAMQSKNGMVGVFGDRLALNSVSKRNGLLSQLSDLCNLGRGQGGATENGIWLFWEQAIKEKIHYDTVFIYSDMQAGRGGLYGINSNDYKDYIYKGRSGKNIDVLALVEMYRKTVNPKVNVFTVQVAGYDNSVLPEDIYRGAVLSGWTGNEALYASALINAWDRAEQK